jgi:hypothetical protein
LEVHRTRPGGQSVSGPKRKPDGMHRTVLRTYARATRRPDGPEIDDGTALQMFRRVYVASNSSIVGPIADLKPRWPACVRRQAAR